MCLRGTRGRWVLGACPAPCPCLRNAAQHPIPGLEVSPWPPRWWHSSSHFHFCLPKHVRVTTHDEPGRNCHIDFDVPPAGATPVTVNHKPFNIPLNYEKTAPEQQHGRSIAQGTLLSTAGDGQTRLRDTVGGTEHRQPFHASLPELSTLVVLTSPKSCKHWNTWNERTRSKRMVCHQNVTKCSCNLWAAHKSKRKRRGIKQLCLGTVTQGRLATSPLFTNSFRERETIRATAWPLENIPIHCKKHRIIEYPESEGTHKVQVPAPRIPLDA